MNNIKIYEQGLLEELLMDFEFETEEAASNVIKRLRNLILLYGHASVRDLFYIAGVVDWHGFDEWGWTDLGDGELTYCFDLLIHSYKLNLPTPKLIRSILKTKIATINAKTKTSYIPYIPYIPKYITVNPWIKENIKMNNEEKFNLRKKDDKRSLDAATVTGLWLDSLPFKDIAKKMGYKETSVRSLLNENPREDILNKAKECVCGNRQEDYGSPEDNFNLIAELWTSYTGCEISATDVSTMMALLKIARIKTGSGTEDSFVDLAGYAACGGEIFIKNAKVEVKMKENENE